MREPILSSDPNAQKQLTERIAALVALQDRYKAINAAHKAFTKNPASLEACNLSEADKTLIRQYVPRYTWEPHPIAPYQLTNNSGNIRRLEKRLESVSEAQSTPATVIQGDSVRLEEVPAENRVRLFFPGKPEWNIRQRLKSAGFRWTPTLECWQAYRNVQSLTVAKHFAGVEEEPAAAAA